MRGPELLSAVLAPDSEIEYSELHIRMAEEREGINRRGSEGHAGLDMRKTWG